MLRWAVATTLTLTLAGMVPSGAVGQSPSPDPPPWFGGRVEMPEHGFAVTLPDDWVAFDSGSDFRRQVETASDFVDSGVWGVGGRYLLEYTAHASDFHVVAFRAARPEHCGWRLVGPAAGPVRDLADGVPEHYADVPEARDFEQPQRLDLPIGPAYRTDWSWLAERDYPGLRGPRSFLSTFFIGEQANMLVAICEAHGTRPADDWLTIVETVEFLPTAQSGEGRSPIEELMPLVVLVAAIAGVAWVVYRIRYGPRDPQN